MNAVTVSRRIAAPRDVVWATITDLDRAPQVMPAIQRIERLQGDGFEVGTRWRETRKVFGREATETMEVTAVDPPHRYVVEADASDAHYRSEFTLADEAGGTRVTMTYDAEPRGTASRLMAATVGRLLTGATRKAVAADLDDVARACEQDTTA